MKPSTSVIFVLPDHIHLAWCGADIVILDLIADEYGLLVDAAEVISEGKAAGTICVDPDVYHEIETLGLASVIVSTALRLSLPQRTGDMPGQPVCSRPLESLTAAVNNTMAAARFHGRPLSRLVRSASRRRAARRAPPMASLARAVGAFQAVQPWIPFEGDCLQRGYRLHHHLHAHGFDARWVFGVRTWPFLAHCWVQVDDLVVGDSLERVSGFTPILAV